MNNALESLTQLFIEWGLGQAYAGTVARLALIVSVILLSILANYIAKKIIVTTIKVVISKTKTKWDDFLADKKVFERLAHLAPAIVIYLSVNLIFPEAQLLREFVQRVINAYMIFVVALVLDALFNVGLEIYRTFKVSKERPIRVYVQVAKIALYVVAAILIIATLMNQSPWALLSGLGAMTAIVLLVFKDSILGFVASIQLSANNMVKLGDWIEMPKYGADGDVTEINLTTVKVQNWDKTITTIPTYSLISDAFKNWRGMSESGGRRIKRSICIDMNSVKFCSDEMIVRFRKIHVLREFIEQKEAELNQYNEDHNIDTSILVNGRRMTNLGTFRAYIEAYLRNHPKVHQNMTFLVRHLAPTEHGIPIEIYVFSNDQKWANYEAIQADIFDHMLAVIPQFDLKVYQNPSGGDLEIFASVYSKEQANAS